MSLPPRERLKGLLAGQRGLTLVEVIVALWIVTVIGSILVGSVRQMNVIASRGAEQIATEADLRTSMQWLAKDLRMAETSDLEDGASARSCASLSPGPCVILQWTDHYGGSSTSHSASYALVGTEFRRTYDGATMAVARNVAEVQVSRTASLVTVTLTSTSTKWGDISTQFTHYFRLGPS